MDSHFLLVKPGTGTSEPTRKVQNHLVVSFKREDMSVTGVTVVHINSAERGFPTLLCENVKTHDCSEITGMMSNHRVLNHVGGEG